MKTIWKYNLIQNNPISIDLPVNSEILCVQVQNKVPHMWIKVDNKNPIIKRTFGIFGTGMELPNIEIKYIDTFQLSGESLVFHVFEIF